MQVNRGLVFWGLTLVTAGTVALLVQAGAIDDETTRQAWRWWPVALIAVGLAVIAERTPFAFVATAVAALVVGALAGSLAAGWPPIGIGCGGEATEVVTESGAFDADRADVELRLNCGELDVSTATGRDWSVDARHGRDGRPTLTSTGDSLRLVAERSGPIGFAQARQEWDVELPADAAFDLDLHANAASSRLDLADATLSRLRLDTNAGDVRVDVAGASVSDLTVEMNAGSVRIIADADTSLAGSADMNAGSLELCVPDDLSVEIALDDPNVTFNHNLGEAGFSESGDTWRAGDGAPAVRLEVDGNAASFTVNPDGGCS